MYVHCAKDPLFPIKLKIETRVLYCPRGTEKYKCISKTNPDAKMLRRFKVDPV